MWITKYTFDKLFSFLFPKRCFICHKEKTTLCNSCSLNFSRSVDNPFIWIRTHYSFKDEQVKKIIYAIKYYHRKDLIEPVVLNVLTKKLREEIYSYKDPIIIPIPMSNLRKYIRGYNHSELLAESYAKHLNIPLIKNLITKSKHTKQQAKIKTRKQRLSNPEKSFELKNYHQFINSHIILIDDVTTTGSTLLSAYKILEKSGFKNITAICIAH